MLRARILRNVAPIGLVRNGGSDNGNPGPHRPQMYELSLSTETPQTRKPQGNPRTTCKPALPHHDSPITRARGRRGGRKREGDVMEEGAPERGTIKTARGRRRGGCGETTTSARERGANPTPKSARARHVHQASPTTANGQAPATKQSGTHQPKRNTHPHGGTSDK